MGSLLLDQHTHMRLNHKHKHTLSFLWKESVLNSVIGLRTWFILSDNWTIFQSRWEGREEWQHATLQTEGLYVWWEEMRNMWTEHERRAGSEGQLKTRLIEREKNTLHGCSIWFPTEFNSKVSIFFCAAGPLDYNPWRRDVSSHPTHPTHTHTHTRTEAIAAPTEVLLYTNREKEKGFVLLFQFVVSSYIN